MPVWNESDARAPLVQYEFVTFILHQLQAVIHREITQHLKSSFQQYPIVTVTGPRQSGKTTLCRETFPGLHYVNLESPDDREFAESDPRGFLAQLGDGGIIDEVQRVPDLLSYIQVAVDEKRSNSLFILTGSAQFELHRRITQSLAGRTALLRLLPLSLPERRQAGASDAVDDILYSGFYPRIIAEQLNPTQALAGYFETYVERDVRQLAEIRNLSQFRRFVRLCAGRVGQLVNFNALGADAGVSHTTARTWLTLLEESYIIFQLPPYFANMRKRLIKSPKLYFYDVGLAAYLNGIQHAGQVATHPLRGGLFENTVVVEAFKHRWNRGNRPDDLTFFRDAKGLECDLLYPTGQEVAAFEVKSGATISSAYFGSLHRVANLVPNVTSKIVVYGGTERQTRSNGKVIPLANLGGTLDRLEVDREIDAFVEGNKGLAPDDSDVRALDIAYTRFIRPELDELETERQRLSALFAGDHQFSYVSMDSNETNSSGLLEARHWPQTRAQYIVVDGLKLSSNRPLELTHTYRFNRYTGKGHGGFNVEFSIQWRLDGAKLSRSATIDRHPIPELGASVDYQELDTRTVDVDQTAAVAARHIRQRIGELSSYSGGEP